MDRQLKRQLGLVFGFVFVDLLGYSLILPLLPYYAETFGATLTLVGLLGTSNAVAQLIAAPIIGRMSDRYGRRPLLIFSIAGTVLSFLVLGLARTLPMLFLSRILDGLLGGNIALARAYITDVTDEKSRSRGLGIIGAAFGLGFIIGPAMGGALSRFGYNVPALVAAGLSLVNLIAVVLWLPESLRREVALAATPPRPRASVSLQALREALKRPCMGPLLQVLLLYGLAFTLFQSNFALFTKERLGLEAQSTAFVLTYVGLLSVLVQGVAIGRLTDRFNERPLIMMSAMVLAASLPLWAFVPNVLSLLVILAPIALAAGVLNVVLTSQLTKSVYRDEVGGTLGLSASLQTLAQIVAPGLGGLLLDLVGPWSVGLLGGLIMLGALVVIRRRVLTISESDMVSCSAAT
ncbi:MAG: MFS transporter [Anaerolineae bacterium]|jgi:DHA1 family tetracycline resistance protein-like MFS transporter|nr:MFS transporter [Anaerolineae bacterium]